MDKSYIIDGVAVECDKGIYEVMYYHKGLLITDVESSDDVILMEVTDEQLKEVLDNSYKYEKLDVLLILTALDIVTEDKENERSPYIRVAGSSNLGEDSSKDSLMFRGLAFDIDGEITPVMFYHKGFFVIEEDIEEGTVYVAPTTVADLEEVLKEDKVEYLKILDPQIIDNLDKLIGDRNAEEELKNLGAEDGIFEWEK